MGSGEGGSWNQCPEDTEGQLKFGEGGVTVVHGIPAVQGLASLTLCYSRVNCIYTLWEQCPRTREDRASLGGFGQALDGLRSRGDQPGPAETQEHERGSPATDPFVRCSRVVLVYVDVLR